MAIIKAPYNFVPLNKKVVSPYWAEYVSHDVPFEDGESGEIEIEITAASPIFVKGGMGKKEAETYFDNNRQIKPFRFSKNQNGKFFIPGSSIKGMVRSVLEIVTFGDLSRKVNDVKYSVRDFRNKRLYNPSQISQEVKCGWLISSDDGYVLENSGPIRRISHKEIESKFKIGGFANTDGKAAADKIKKVKNLSDTFNFRKIAEQYGQELYAFDNEGELSGRVVVTGQPSSKKKKEFVFIESGNTEPVPKDIIKNFFWAYYDHDVSQQQKDWKYWKEKLVKGEKVPVFYRKQRGQFQDLGLAMLYKIVYKNSVIDSIQHAQEQKKYDFSETLFGHTNKEGGLKGRVHFSHATEIDGCSEGEEFRGVLSSPKASYYPTYIRQKGGEYQTFMNDTAVISGWKRYPIHAEGVKRNPRPDKSTENILTRFIPLNTGARFGLKIKYHNLKPVEVGALLSALTFHNTSPCFHTLGMGKPLGYGKVKVDVLNLKELEKYLKAFECFMNIELEFSNPEWHKQTQIKELIAMSSPQENDGPSSLEYMKLGRGRGNNDFEEAKKDNQYLKRYSILTKSTVFVNSLCTANDIAAMKAKCEKEEKALSSLVSFSKLKSQKEKEGKKELEKLIKKYKDAKIDELKQKKADLAEKERLEKEVEEEKDREAKKLEKQQQAREESFAAFLEGVLDVHPRDAFGELKRSVEDYSRAFHMMSDKELSEKFPNGFLPKKDHDTLLEVLARLYEKQSKKEAKKWIKPFNKNYLLKTVAKWIGEEKAKQIKFTV